jgi:hypothetical protein
MTELFIAYPDFKWLELNIFTKNSPQSVTQALFAESPTSIGEFGKEKVILDFGLPDEVRKTPPKDEEYGPMIALLIDNDGSRQRLDLTLSRSTKDDYIHAKLIGEQVEVLFDGDIRIQEVDDDCEPHKLA